MFDYQQIITFFRQQFTKNFLSILVVLFVLFFLTRLINLDQWPIFSDEGIYIRWAKVAWKDASWRFISLTDGRQPLQTWGTIPFLKLFSTNALLAGRLFSVTTGLVSFIGIFGLLFYLWGKKAALIGSLLYVFMPYTIFYDRIALVDSAVNAGFIWIIFLSIVLVRSRRLDMALILGFIGGFSLLAKSSSKMFLMLALSAPIIYIKNSQKKLISNSINYFILLFVAIAIGVLFYNIQRLSPYFHFVSLKNNTFVMTFSEFMSTPFAYIHNFRLIPLFVAWESGWFIVPFSILGLIKLYKKDIGLALYISVFIVLPYIAIGLFAKVLFPRYVLFYSTILILCATYYFAQIKTNLKRGLIISLLVLTMIIFDYPLIFNPILASFPPVDRGQYVEGITSVWGAKELMGFLQKESTKQPVIILAEGNFGLVADVLDVYLQDGDSIEIKGMWPLEKNNLMDAQKNLEDKKIYVVFSHRESFPEDWPLKLIKKYSKPVGDRSLYLFELTN